MLSLLCCPAVFAATVTTGEMTLPTYMFHDPDPVPKTRSDYYPYYRFDGYEAKSSPRDWKTVTLESDKLKITVTPEVGGKIWGAIDKISGVDFIYFNNVAKFRDISMRGPWSSGGIEFNFGKMGHEPYTSAPVDYFVRTNADGSVSCFVGGTEWLCRTFWQVEIRLKDGDDGFETKAIWFNASNLPQTYYQWMNAAFLGGDGTRYFFPGKNWISHGGKPHSWPVEDGHDLSLYSQNDIPGFDEDHRAMHIMNGDNRYFGVWWPQYKAGALHESRLDEKYGRKIWMWGLSRQGAIWEGLLTDTDGPYVELQSGRCFQQPNTSFWSTPFKFPSFAPGGTDVFSERWSVVRDEKAFERLDTYKNIEPRPLEMPKNFDWDSAYGRYVKGIQKLREGQGFDPVAAEKALRLSIEKEACFAPALNALAGLYISQGRLDEARDLVRTSMSVDTYDAEANYLDALALVASGDRLTARERLGLAAYSPALRSAALALSARLLLAEGDYRQAKELADASLEANARNIDALAVRVVARRLSGDLDGAAQMARKVLEDIPLHHLFRHELALCTGTKAQMPQDEFPGKTITELALWYEISGLTDEALALYDAVGASIVSRTRAAYLAHKTGRSDAANRLRLAAETDIGLDFPFRWESLPAFRWAAEKTGSWKFRYLTALVLASRGRDVEADAELEACADTIDDVNALLFRAARRPLAKAMQDLEKARRLGDSWRVGLGLYHAYAVAEKWMEARLVLEDYVKRYPGKLGLELNYARALVKTGAWESAVEFLDGISTLPSELGEKPITIYQEALGALAERALRNGDEKAAKAYALKAIAYPETLGAGKPYLLDKLFSSWPKAVSDFCRREGLK